MAANSSWQIGIYWIFSNNISLNNRVYTQVSLKKD